MTMLRPAVALCVIAVLQVPSAAAASTVRVAGSSIEYRSSTEQHNLRISVGSGGEILLEELAQSDGQPRPHIAAESPCTAGPTPDHSATCPASGITLLDVDVGASFALADTVVNDVAGIPMRAVTHYGSDRLIGSDGAADGLDARGGGDQLEGRAGDDRLYGGWDADRLSGGPGDDRLYGDSHADRLSGGPGDDRLDGGWGADLLVGDEGYDWADYSSRDEGVSVTMGSGDEPGETPTSEGDQINVYGDRSVEGLIGGAGRDLLSGDGGANRIYGGPGGDFLHGGGAPPGTVDELFGEEGDDSLGAGFAPTAAGAVLVGGPGDDTLSSGPARDTMLGGPGTDSVSYVGVYWKEEGRRTPVYVNLGDGLVNDGPVEGESDLVNVAGDYSIEGAEGGWAPGDWLIGDDRDNHLVGLPGANTIDGRGGDDHISGGIQDDHLTGGPGEDELLAFEGNDVLNARDGERDTLMCSGGTDLLFGDPVDLFIDSRRSCEAGGVEVRFDVAVPSPVLIPRNGVMRFVVPCAPPAVGACKGSIRLDVLSHGRRMRIGTKRFELPAGASRAVRVRLSKRGRARVEAHRNVRVRFMLSGRDPYETAPRLVRTFLLRARS